MEVIDRDMLVKEMVDHPYESNPDYTAKVNIFYYSPDRKFTAAYWEAPVGWFDAVVNGFNEIDYVIEGEMELVSEEKTLIAKAGDCFLIKDGDRFRWKLNKFTKVVFFIYPLTKEIEDLCESFYKKKICQ
jgi:uncharacterized cupin superfamily protein